MNSRIRAHERVACILLALAVHAVGILALWTSLNLFIAGNILASMLLFWFGFIACLWLRHIRGLRRRKGGVVRLPILLEGGR